MTKISKDSIIILPLGATEQHGPHLSSDTDTIIATEFANRLKDNCPNSDLIILPVEHIGYSIEHLDFQNTKSLTYAQAVEKWLSIIEEYYTKGGRKFLLLNAHGGNSPLMTIVATEARVRWNILVVSTSWSRFGLPDGLNKTIDRTIDIHAGMIETSMMLAIDPKKVDMSKAQDFTSKQTDYISTLTHLRAYGPHAFGWKMQDLNKKGAVGNASAATATIGEAIIAHAMVGLQSVIRDMEKFECDSFE